MEIKEEVVTKVVRYIEFDGIRFYPDKRGYWLAKAKGWDKPKRLHQYVWEYYNGPIPEGYHVHHKDFNPDNNDIQNLELISKEEHLKYHAGLQDKVWARNNLLENAIPAAAEWHKSEEGRAWHREHYKETLSEKWAEKVTKVCQFCGKEYQVPYMVSEGSRFCSNACKSAWRRKSGIDNVEIPCAICGKPILTNKYSPKRYCSEECLNVMRRKAIEKRELNRKLRAK